MKVEGLIPSEFVIVEMFILTLRRPFDFEKRDDFVKNKKFKKLLSVAKLNQLLHHSLNLQIDLKEILSY